jgi:hypothetical protein
MAFDAAPVSQEQLDEFNVLLKQIEGHLAFLMKSKPLLRREWDTDDFSQELALKYFRNILQIAPTLKSNDHRLSLIKKMAKQVANDKLRTIQRKKRDTKRLVRGETKFLEGKGDEPITNMCIQEALGAIKSKANEMVWEVLGWRSEGKSWQDCSDDVGYTSPSALRLKVNRHVELLKERLAVYVA